MSELYTTQGSYKVLRDQTAFAATLDGSTAGKTFHWHDLPDEAVPIGGEYNGCEIIFTSGEKSITGETTGTNDGTTFDGKIWGYTYGGPAELVSEFSATVGTARVNDYTTALYIDGLVEVTDEHVSGVTVVTTSNRVGKMIFDTIGYSHIYCDFTVNGAAGSNTSDVKAHIRPY